MAAVIYPRDCETSSRPILKKIGRSIILSTKMNQVMVCQCDDASFYKNFILFIYCICI